MPTALLQLISTQIDMSIIRNVVEDEIVTCSAGNELPVNSMACCSVAFTTCNEVLYQKRPQAMFVDEQRSWLCGIDESGAKTSGF